MHGRGREKVHVESKQELSVSRPLFRMPLIPNFCLDDSIFLQSVYPPLKHLNSHPLIPSCLYR